MRIGTLFDFRRQENEEIRDEAEGKHELVLNFEGEVELDRRLANLLVQPAFVFGDASDTPRLPGSTQVHAERLYMVGEGSKPDTVVLRDTVVRVSRSLNDCLVFCMSKPGTEPPFSYASSWRLSGESIEAFAAALCRLVFHRARLDHGFARDHQQLLLAAAARKLRVQVAHGPVIYQDRTMHITQATVPTLDEFLYVIDRIAFTKPASFAHEQEYRFMFQVHDGEHEFPPLRPVLLSTSELWQFAT